MFSQEESMKPKSLTLALMVLFCCIASATFVRAQEDQKPPKSEAPEPRAKDGKKLLTSLDLMKINGVGAPRISPDGSRVAYTVSETKMEKDKEWKTLTHVWVTPTKGGGTFRQYTRGEKSATARECAPGGKLTGSNTARD